MITPPLDIAPRHWKIVKDILFQYPFHFYAFGSRAKKTAKKFSDLDLYYKDSIPNDVIHKLVEAFEESNLPFKVELLNWHQCDVDFQKEIEKNSVLL